MIAFFVKPDPIERLCSLCFEERHTADPTAATEEIVAMRAINRPSTFGVLAAAQSNGTLGHNLIRVQNESPTNHLHAAEHTNISVQLNEDSKGVAAVHEVAQKQIFSFATRLWTVFPSVRLSTGRLLLEERLSSKAACLADCKVNMHITVSSAAELQRAIRGINRRWGQEPALFSTVFPFHDMQPAVTIVVEGDIELKSQLEIHAPTVILGRAKTDGSRPKISIGPVCQPIIISMAATVLQGLEIHGCSQ